MESVIELAFPQGLPMPHGHLQGRWGLRRGELNALIGGNGVGKSTLLRFLWERQEQFFPGERVVLLDQMPLSPLGERRVVDLFRFVEEQRGVSIPYPRFREHPLYQKLGFGRYEGTSIRHLSGGENQILKLLLTFNQGSDLIFLDEPFNHLDLCRMQVLEEWLQAQRGRGQTLVVVDHRWDFFRRLEIPCAEIWEEGAGQFTLGPTRQEGLCWSA